MYASCVLWVLGLLPIESADVWWWREAASTENTEVVGNHKKAEYGKLRNARNGMSASAHYANQIHPPTEHRM